MLNLKDIINGQAKVQAKAFNTDLFKGDNENITEDFSRENYDKLIAIDSTSTDNQLKETIIGLRGADAYLINATSASYNGDIQTSITQKWLTLQGFNYFTKDFFMFSDNEFVDAEGHLTYDIQEFYTNVLRDNDYDISYSDIIELGIYNPEYKVIILSFEDSKENKHFLTINDKGQLSKITKKLSSKKVAEKETPKQQFKSILG